MHHILLCASFASVFVVQFADLITRVPPLELSDGQVKESHVCEDGKHKMHDLLSKAIDTRYSRHDCARGGQNIVA